MNQAELAELRALIPNCLRHDRQRLEAKLTRWEHAAARGSLVPSLQPLMAEARRAVAIRHRRHERLPQVTYPPDLPISARKDEIVAAIRAHPVVIIAGETGSGKTTQIPKMCLEAGCGVEGQIGCTQPRRVAALSISRRIAQELGANWGEEVGCKIRFTDRSGPTTYIKLMTDGILLAETQGDRDLTEYDALIIDEAHERSLNIDFLLGHLKLLLRRRSDVKVVITSATIDTEAFSRAFGQAPVIEVSGRTYPVEIRYAPHDPDAEESGELTYIDAAVQAAEQVLLESHRGDVLIFMPSERDIRETVDDLQGRYAGEAEIIPLFGRLASGEQDRVFAPSPRRKIIVATNIAETSLTIPGVRYVIDTGLARVSRYSPRSRTKRLPIEPISQSSARQRAGRSGRVEAGVCIRLYAEEDWAARPKDTQPEIQRANLAEVILKMKAWRLGEMGTFPFINPPHPQAVQSGYQLLQELGALDPERQLTPLGRDLARLPVDPSIGRMILQSLREGALPEVLIIAAGLSIQDPRERPQDKQDAADQAHRQFIDPRSDFLTLLNIWEAFDAQFEALRTQNQMRRFCRANFLSYPRMREWIDVHAQLEDAVRGLRPATRAGTDTPPPNPPGKKPTVEERRYAAVHRSVLTGLLGHAAQRLERNLYRASGNRQVMLWPGSGLFDRNAQNSHKGPASPKADSGKVRRPSWIVAGEMVETSRLFARTVAGVQPEWIAELGAHVCQRTYSEPSWDRRLGRVLARERVTLFGLEVQVCAVDYGRVHPQQATDLFLRAALVDGDLDGRYSFLDHNARLRQRIEVWRTQHRNHRLPDPDEALLEFYRRHLHNVSSVHDLNRLLREQRSPEFLCARETDLTGGLPVAWDAAAFPSEVAVAGQRAQLEYAYAPGQEHDGIMVKIPVSLAHRVEPRMLDWLVPGLRAEQIEVLLRALPKSLRVPLMPIAPKVADLAAVLPPDAGLAGLRELIREKYGVSIPATAWTRDLLPNHLRPLIAITGAEDKVLATGRDLERLKQDLEKHESSAELAAWAQAAQRWERYDLRGWTFGDLPERIHVTEAAGAPLIAFPGLEQDSASVHLRLFRKPSEAEAASRAGFAALVELALHKELAWVQKDLRGLEKLGPLHAGFLSSEELQASACDHLRRALIQVPEPVLPLKQSSFEAAVQTARNRLPGLIPQLMDSLAAILRLRHDLARHRGLAAVPLAPRGLVTDFKQLPPRTTAPKSRPLDFLPDELAWLMPPDFLRRIPSDRLRHWPRYLKALLVRADRALLNPAKDAEKAKRIAPYREALDTLSRGSAGPPSPPVAELRWLLEEFKVSVFAQELGTAEPVSEKKLDALVAAIRQTTN